MIQWFGIGIKILEKLIKCKKNLNIILNRNMNKKSKNIKSWFQDIDFILIELFIELFWVKTIE